MRRHHYPLLLESRPLVALLAIQSANCLTVGCTPPRYRCKIDLRAGATTDPVPLQLLDARRPVDLLQIFLQSVRVSGDAEHPFPERNANDRMAATLTDPTHDLFVRKHRPQCRAPLHGRFANTPGDVASRYRRTASSPLLTSVGIGNSLIGRPRCIGARNQVFHRTAAGKSTASSESTLWSVVAS